MFIDSSIINNLPKLELDNKDDTTLMEAEIVSGEKYLGQMKCIGNDGNIIDNEECIPCNMYNFKWDPDYKRCKMSVKNEPKVIQDDKENIIGYAE